MVVMHTVSGHEHEQCIGIYNQHLVIRNASRSVSVDVYVCMSVREMFPTFLIILNVSI